MPKNFQTYTTETVISAVLESPRKLTPPGNPRAWRIALTGPLAGSRMNCITTPTIAVVVTTGRKKTVRKNFESGSFGEFSTIASRKLKMILAGATRSMKSSVILNEFQNSGSANTWR